MVLEPDAPSLGSFSTLSHLLRLSFQTMCMACMCLSYLPFVRRFARSIERTRCVLFFVIQPLTMRSSMQSNSGLGHLSSLLALCQWLTMCHCRSLSRPFIHQPGELHQKVMWQMLHHGQGFRNQMTNSNMQWEWTPLSRINSHSIPASNVGLSMPAWAPVP